MTRYRTIVADPPWPIGEFPPNFGYATGKPVPYSTMNIESIATLPVCNLADLGAHLYLWTTNAHLRASYDIASGWGFAVQCVLVWCKPPHGLGLGGKFVSNTEFILFCRNQAGALRVTEFLAAACERAGITRREVDAYMSTSDMAGWWLSRLPHRCACPTVDQWERLKAWIGFDDSMDEAVHGLSELKASDDKRVSTRWFAWKRGAHSAKPEAFLDLVEQVSPGPYLELFARRNRLGWDTWGNQALQHVEMGA